MCVLFVVIAAAVVAVMVTVVVAITVITVTAGNVGAIEQDGHVLVAFLVVILLDVGELILFQESGTDHKDRHIGKTVDNLGVRNNLHRRTVDYYVVVVGAQLVDKLVKLWT